MRNRSKQQFIVEKTANFDRPETQGPVVRKVDSAIHWAKL